MDSSEKERVVAQHYHQGKNQNLFFVYDTLKNGRKIKTNNKICSDKERKNGRLFTIVMKSVAKTLLRKKRKGKKKDKE
jgi:hypoxanthine-guanine phosphoribosyltransferase